MKHLDFKDEEVVALSALETFGIIDSKENFHSENAFSNVYFKNLVKYGKAEKDLQFDCDEYLLENYKPIVQKFAEDKKNLFKVFEAAYMKMTRIGYEPNQLKNAEDLIIACEIRIP